MAVGSNSFYSITVSNLTFEQIPTIDFPFLCRTILIVPDTLTDDLEYSFNGREVCGVIHWDDEKLVISDTETGRIWFKTNNPNGTKVRVFVEAY
jgi:hypothetical protein